MKASAQARHFNEDSSWLIEAARRVLRPAVRFVMGKVPCSVLIDLLKEVYLDEATLYLQRKNPDKAVTNAALAALSGLDGRVIKAIQSGQRDHYSNADLCVEAAILEMWSDNPLFQDDQGCPAELHLHGPGRSFQGLVRRAAGRAVTPQTVLDDLLVNKNIELDGDRGVVRLLSSTFSNLAPSDKTAIIAGSHASCRLAKSVAHNMGRADDPGIPAWLQQDRWSVRIPPERVNAIRSEIRQLLEKNIDQVVDVLAEEERELRNAHQSVVGVGWYYWEE